MIIFSNIDSDKIKVTAPINAIALIPIPKMIIQPNAAMQLQLQDGSKQYSNSLRLMSVFYLCYHNRIVLESDGSKMDSKPTTVDTFDNLADRYDSWFDRHKAAFESEVAALQKVIPKSGDGLEVGVGSGRFAAALGIKTGIEPSASLRKLAKQRGITVFEGVAEALPFPKESLDYVLLGTVLCYLTSPLQGLTEAKRVLRPDGLLIIGMIDRNSALGQTYEARKCDNPFYKDAHFYSIEEIITLMKQVGFAPKEFYQTIFSPLETIKLPENVRTGYGKGGYIVIKAVDTLYGIDADVP